MMKGVDDLDFYIGDEAVDKPTYSTKVPGFLMSQQTRNVLGSKYHFLNVFRFFEEQLKNLALVGDIVNLLLTCETAFKTTY